MESDWTLVLGPGVGMHSTGCHVGRVISYRNILETLLGSDSHVNVVITSKQFDESRVNQACLLSENDLSTVL